MTLAVLAALGLLGAAPPPTFDGLVKQATEARSGGKLDAAASYYQKALALKPSWIEGRWELATLLYDMDRPTDAREHFRYFVAARRDDGLAWAMTGLCDVRLKDYDTALADLKQAHALGISSPEIRGVAALQTALLVNRAGDPEGAFEMLRPFAARGNDSPPVIVAFGLAMLRLRTMPEDVAPEKRDMVQLAGRGAYHMARGRRTAVGRLALEELVSRYSAEPNVHYALGAYLAADDPDAAIEEFRKELRAAPDHFPSLVYVASLQIRQGNAADALPLAEQAVGLAPELPGARLTLGRALLETGSTERAVKELEKGASLAPESAEMQFALARAYQRAGRGEDATRAREMFLKLDQAARDRQAEPESKDQEPKAPPGGSDKHGGSN